MYEAIFGVAIEVFDLRAVHQNFGHRLQHAAVDMVIGFENGGFPASIEGVQPLPIFGMEIAQAWFGDDVLPQPVEPTQAMQDARAF